MAYIDGIRDARTLLEVLRDYVRPAPGADQADLSGKEGAGDQAKTAVLGLRVLRDIGLRREHQDYSARASQTDSSDRRLHRIVDTLRY